SIIRGQIKAAKAKRARGETAGPPPIISFHDGLGRLPAALAAGLPAGVIETEATVESLLRGEGGWNLVWSRGGRPQTETVGRIVLALPAHALARLTIGPLGERPLASLGDIVYPPVAALFLGSRPIGRASRREEA